MQSHYNCIDFLTSNKRTYIGSQAINAVWFVGYIMRQSIHYEENVSYIDDV